MTGRPRLLDDAWLAPYAGVIRARAARAAARAEELTCGRGSLADWARAHEYFGLHRTADGGWVFRERAPNATDVWLTGDFTGWELRPRFRLKRLAGTDVWERAFPARAIRHGQHYRLEMAWPGGRGERIPAFARRVVQDARTGLFAAQVWEPKEKYVWKNDLSPADSADHAEGKFTNKNLRNPRNPRKMKNGGLFIYEAHVGMAQEEGKVGTYAEFRDNILPRVKAAGYTAVQLMAVMEHPYYGSFGYHVSSFFAASSRFGTPEELKSLVDAAHGMGLAVIMDLVHSHAVKNERDGLSLFDGTPYLYFHDGARGWHTAWDSRCFDYGKTETLHFLLSNCRYWLDEFHFDGFRFDGVTSMLYRNHGLGENFTHYGMYFGDGVDEDAWCYLALANRVAHEVNPRAVTVAEDVSGMPGCASPLKDGGMGFDFRMAMGLPDFWFRLAEKVRDEDWRVTEIFRRLTDKRAEERAVSYVESHDQALVGGKTFFFQLVDAAVYRGMGRGQHDLTIERGVALHKMARLATAACAGGAYLNFMGNEFGHPEWIDFPRAENGWDYSHARRQWSLRDDDALLFKPLADFDAAMTGLLKRRRVLGARPAVCLHAHDGDQVLAFWRNGCVFVFNFNAARSFTDYGVLVPAGSYRRALDTDEARFGGQSRIAAKQVFFSEGVLRGNERVEQIRLYLPARTALVLTQT